MSVDSTGDKTLNKHVLIVGPDTYIQKKTQKHVHTNPPTHEKLTIWNITIFKREVIEGSLCVLCTALSNKLEMCVFQNMAHYWADINKIEKRIKGPRVMRL